MPDQADRARRLRDLHHQDRPLVLPNVWDAGTTNIVASHGFPAIATSSAAVAESNGYRDHEEMPPDVAFDAVRRIAAAAGDLPVTADMESGYGLPADEFVDRLLDTGAVGCNYEDTDHANPGALHDPDDQAARIAALRQAADRHGVPLVINARVDTFLHRVDNAYDEGVRRARLYLEAGADCVYPILLSDEAEIARFVADVPGPVNVMWHPAAPPVTRLAELGVRRISVGGGLYRPAMKRVVEGLAALSLDPQ